MGRRVPCSLLNPNPVGQIVLLNNRKSLVILVGNKTREGAIKALVEGRGWDVPPTSDRSEFLRLNRLVGGLTKVFFSIIDGHCKEKRIKERRKRIKEELRA